MKSETTISTCTLGSGGSVHNKCMSVEFAKDQGSVKCTCRVSSKSLCGGAGEGTKLARPGASIYIVRIWLGLFKASRRSEPTVAVVPVRRSNNTSCPPPENDTRAILVPLAVFRSSYEDGSEAYNGPLKRVKESDAKCIPHNSSFCEATVLERAVAKTVTTSSAPVSNASWVREELKFTNNPTASKTKIEETKMISIKVNPPSLCQLFSR